MGLHTVLVTGDGLAMGRFDIPSTHEAWRRDNRQHGAHLLAFPGPPVRIIFPGEVPVVADRHQVLFYSDAQVYRRSLLSADGDHCTFVVVADDVVRRIVREFDPAAAAAQPFRFRHTQAFIGSRTYLMHRTLALCADPGVECATRVLETVVHDCLAAAYRPRARPARTEPARTPAGRHDRFRLVEEAKAAVADPYGRPPSLESVANRVGASPFHLTGSSAT